MLQLLSLEIHFCLILLWIFSCFPSFQTMHVNGIFFPAGSSYLEFVNGASFGSQITTTSTPCNYKFAISCSSQLHFPNNRLHRHGWFHIARVFSDVHWLAAYDYWLVSYLQTPRRQCVWLLGCLHGNMLFPYSLTVFYFKWTLAIMLAKLVVLAYFLIRFIP